MAIPLSASQVRLLESVPFSNDYKHTRYFTSITSQTNYFLNKPTAFIRGNSNFQKIEGKYYVAVDTPIEDLWKVNYMMFRNNEYEDKWFYAFVTQIEYKNRSTTYVYFEVDVFQTFWWDIVLKPSYVVREHENQWQSNGHPEINTLQEGLDYGRDYELRRAEKITPFNGVKFLVIGCMNQIHGTTPSPQPTIVGTLQPLSYYVIPFLDGGGLIQMYYSNTAETFNITTPTTLLSEIFEHERTVNNIATMYVTEHIGVDMVVGSVGSTTQLILPNNNKLRPQYIGGDTTLRLLHVHEIRQFEGTLIDPPDIGNKYDGFLGVSESKLLMYPYAYTEITDFKGNQMVVKNEYLDSNRYQFYLQGSIGTSNKMTWQLLKYNSYVPDSSDRRVSIRDGIIDDSTNDLPIINTQLSAYLQGNKNSIRNQKQASIFNGIMQVGGGVINTVAGMTPTQQAGGVLSVVGGLGNTYYDIKGLQAREQDIANIPPNLTKMGDNTQFDYGNRYNGIWILKKHIKQEYRAKLSSFFRMFGYKSDRVKYPNFNTRQAYNYVQTKSCIITGSINNEHLEKLKSVFDNGITVWHNDDVGNYTQSNGVK